MIYVYVYIYILYTYFLVDSCHFLGTFWDTREMDIWVESIHQTHFPSHDFLGSQRLGAEFLELPHATICPRATGGYPVMVAWWEGIG